LISFFVSAQNEPFITTWEVEGNNLSITIPTEGEGYNYTVDFGDGTVVNNQTGDATHTYDSAGVYTVSIYGDFPRIHFPSSFLSSEKLKFVEQWGDIEWTSMERAFKDCKYLQINATDSPDLTQVTNLSSMFEHCENLNSNINDWDVSNVTNFNSMFERAYKFNQPLDNWNVSDAVAMEEMFFGAHKFNQPLNSWNVSNVESFNSMFAHAYKFNQPLNNWDISSVTNLDDMFLFAYEFNQPLDNWDVSNVIYMSSMFNGARKFNQDISNWNFNSEIYDFGSFLGGALMFDVNNFEALLQRFIDLDLQNFSLYANGVFYCDEVAYNVLNNDMGWYIEAETITNCGNFPEAAFVTRWNIDIDENDNVTINSLGDDYNYNIDFGDGTSQSGITGDITHTYTDSGFYRIIITGEFPRFEISDSRLIGIDNWGAIEWQSMENAFLGNESNILIYANDTPDLSQVTSLSGMFKDCENFNSNINDWDVSNVNNFDYMFNGANSFDQPLNNWNVNNAITMEEMFYVASSFNQPLSDWDVSNVSNMDSMFYVASSFNQSLNDWNVSNVEDMSRMFKSAMSFNQPLDQWNVSNVENMSNMFDRAMSFNQPLNDWDVSNVTNMNFMFIDAVSFNQPLNNWDVSSVTSMREMFRAGLDGSNFNQPLEDWDVSNVIDMSGMFNRALAFNQPLEDWDVSNVTDMNYMFRGAISFNQPLNQWNVSNVQNMFSMFSGAISFNQPLNNWDVSNVVGFNNGDGFGSMFYEAESFNQSLYEWEFNVSDLYGFLTRTNLDIVNYDLLLQNLSNSNLQNGTLGAEDLKYCNESVRQYLIDEMGWNIIGDMFSEECNAITGYIKYDSDDNGCDDNDFPFNNQMIFISNENYNFITFSNDGIYNIGLVDNEFEISLINLPDFLEASPESSEIIFTEANQTIQQNFCLTATQTVEDLNITLLPVSQARPGFEGDYRLVIENMGTQTVSLANVSLLFDDTKQSFVVATPAESSSSTNELNFEVNDLSPFNQQVFNFTMQTFQPPTVNGDDILAFTATVTPNTNDYTPEDNTFDYDQVVVNSYDPNDKQILQGDEVHIDDADQYLDYLIRFQNTGTASAINVRVVDTLHPNLDYSSIRPVNASDDYRVEITDGNHVEFIFEDINLPDENSDEPGSHGFIAYKIKPKENVAVGDFVTGDAQIYFDFNEPIITNMVSTQFVEDLSVNEYDKSRTISIYPNPTTGILNIQKNTTLELNEINIYNLQGKRLLNFSENLEKLTIENLSAGIYLLQIQTNQGVINKQLIKN